MESERMADIIQEMRMARTGFPFAYEIGRKDEPAEFDADGLMVKPRSIVIEKVTIEALADRIEKAWEREQPQADPDWKEICEKCKDGEIEPDCEYYGEPNGCNSPIYGEHPKSQPIGNAAALRDTLEGIRLWFIASANVLEEDTTARVTPRALRKLAKDCEGALAKTEGGAE